MAGPIYDARDILGSGLRRLGFSAPQEMVEAHDLLGAAMVRRICPACGESTERVYTASKVPKAWICVHCGWSHVRQEKAQDE
jgi:predicted RNA-binding Zn-ribbon protein involved in translation (DUF1610 family)